MSKTIGVLIFDGAEELDYVGPWEVFATACRSRADEQVLCIAETEALVHSAKGLRVLPDQSFKSAPNLDVLVVPGGRGIREQLENQVLLRFIRKQAKQARFVASVCTGAALLAAAGPAKGKRVTTHHSYVEDLSRRGDCEVLGEMRFVRDGKIVTSAGVSAGIDMALWMVGQLWSIEHARYVERQIQYEPAPPYRFLV